MRALLLSFGLALFGCGGVGGPVECGRDSDCFENYACDATTNQCLRACTSDGNCLASEFCDIPLGTSNGVCRYDDPAQGD